MKLEQRKRGGSGESKGREGREREEGARKGRAGSGGKAHRLTGKVRLLS